MVFRMKNIWHYPRPDLARTYLTHLFEHCIPRLVLSGQRRIGKTEFVTHDIAQILEERGAAFLYCNFWETKNNPHQGFTCAVAKFGKPDVGEPNFTGSLKVGIELGVDVEVAYKPQQASPGQLNWLLQGFDAWLKVLDGKPCLIVLDEIQHLATSSKFDVFTAALRTMLDTVPANIKVLFISSSPPHLSRLLYDPNAPFYRFANVVDFPLLDDAYLQYLAKIYQQITKKTLPLELLASIYQKTGNNAHYTTGAVQTLVLHPDANLQMVWEKLEYNMQQDKGLCHATWGRLSLSSRVVYLLLLEGQEPFSEKSLALYAEKGFSRGMGQRALQTLLSQSLINREGHGQYRTVLPMLDEWLKLRGETSVNQSKIIFD